jgi:hypothetical protein
MDPIKKATMPPSTEHMVAIHAYQYERLLFSRQHSISKGATGGKIKDSKNEHVARIAVA